MTASCCLTAARLILVKISSAGSIQLCGEFFLPFCAGLKQTAQSPLQLALLSKPNVNEVVNSIECLAQCGAHLQPPAAVCDPDKAYARLIEGLLARGVLGCD